METTHKKRSNKMIAFCRLIVFVVREGFWLLAACAVLGIILFTSAAWSMTEDAHNKGE